MITTINVMGYSIALAACITIGTYIYHQTTYDKFNENSKRIFRLNYIQNQKNTTHANTNHQWYDILPLELPEVEKVCRLRLEDPGTIAYNKNSFVEQGAKGDNELFDIFSFPILQKSSENFFEQPYSIAISRSVANKIFGFQNAIGKTVILDHEKEYTVTAIFEDIPQNSSFRFNYLTNAKDAINNYSKKMQKHWSWWAWKTFVLLKQKSISPAFEKQIKQIQAKYIGDRHSKTMDYYLQPLEDIHLGSAGIIYSFDSDVSVNFIYVIFSAGLLILIISCINYVNLSTASFEERKKSISVKKLIGASRSYLFKQHLLYSLTLNLICIVVAILMATIFNPILVLNGANDIEIPLSNFYFWLLILSFSLFIGLLSGIFPANHISKTIIRLNTDSAKSKFGFRNALVVVQFAVAIVLLIATSAIKKQIDKSINGDLGYDHTSLIRLKESESIYDHYKEFHDEIKSIPGVIESTSCGFDLPGPLGNYWGVKPSGSDEKIEIFHTNVAANFFDVMNIPVLNKSRELQVSRTDDIEYAVINNEAVKKFELGESILGRTYKLGTIQEVIGIVADFHNNSTRERIKPVHFIIDDKAWFSLVRIEKLNYKNTINEIKTVWEHFDKKIPFDFEPVDELIFQQYNKERALFKLINLFFVLSIFISLIGMVGLVQLMLRFRIKEIGIRKVNGARVSEILTMLNKDFVKWVAFAFVIATPIAYYAMNKWLENFAYKTTLSWWIFALAGLLALGIALLTVTWQSWRAATRNPVEALRYE